jgi:hypothetical protein
MFDTVRCATEAERRAAAATQRRTGRRRTVEERRRRWFDRAGVASVPTGASG